MPDYFLILLRFYMRVDDVVIRVNDTRLFYEVLYCHTPDVSMCIWHLLSSCGVAAVPVRLTVNVAACTVHTAGFRKNCFFFQKSPTHWVLLGFELFSLFFLFIQTLMLNKSFTYLLSMPRGFIGFFGFFLPNEQLGSLEVDPAHQLSFYLHSPVPYFRLSNNLQIHYFLVVRKLWEVVNIKKCLIVTGMTNRNWTTSGVGFCWAFQWVYPDVWTVPHCVTE